MQKEACEMLKSVYKWYEKFKKRNMSSGQDILRPQKQTKMCKSDKNCSIKQGAVYLRALQRLKTSYGSLQIILTVTNETNECKICSQTLFRSVKFWQIKNSAKRLTF